MLQIGAVGVFVPLQVRQVGQFERARRGREPDQFQRVARVLAADQRVERQGRPLRGVPATGVVHRPAHVDQQRRRR